MKLGSYHGRPYFVGQADGAIPNGGRVRKIDQDSPEETPLGTEGTVLSSVDAREVAAAMGVRGTHFYFVAWDPYPTVPVGVLDWKIEAA